MGYDGSRRYAYYCGAQLGHRTRASTSTERGRIRLSITLAAIACIVAARRQLAALGITSSAPRGNESDQTI